MKKLSILILLPIILLFTACPFFHSGTPHENFDTFEDAIKTLRFTCTEPIVPEGYTIESIIVWVWEVLEITYVKTDSPTIKFRAVIHEEDDYLRAVNSFNLPEDMATEQIENVTVRSTVEDLYYFAYWYIDGISFSLHLGEYTYSGLPFDELSKIIESVTNISNNRIEETEEIEV